MELLGDDAPLFCDIYNVREDGNVSPSEDPHREFTHKNILERQLDYIEAAKKFGITVDEVREKLDRSKNILFKEREKRPKPFLDDKVITAWNGKLTGALEECNLFISCIGLMISAFAVASKILKSDHYLNTAKQATKFIKVRLSCTRR